MVYFNSICGEEHWSITNTSSTCVKFKEEMYVPATGVLIVGGTGAIYTPHLLDRGEYDIFCPPQLLWKESQQKLATKKLLAESSLELELGSLGHSFDGVFTKNAPSTEDEEKSSYLAFLTSMDEAPPVRYDPEPVEAITYQPLDTSTIHEPSYNDNSKSSLSDLTSLVDTNEPITSSHGSWGMREADDSNHHTAPWNRNYDDESGVLARSWYSSDDDDVTMSPHSGSFSEAPPSPKFDQGSGSNGLLPEHNAVKGLTKKINSLKKKIKHFEEEFETSFGYLPSHSEKKKHKDIKKYMSELSKARKELKQINNGTTGLVSTPSVLPLSVLRCQESTTPGSQPTVSGEVLASAASTLQQIEEKLIEKRSACGRKENLFEMTYDELQEEKTALQKSLLYFEYVHGRPKTREERDLARPLYDRYRQCKRIVFRAESYDKENMGNLPTIVEHETMDFTLASPQNQGSITPTFEEEVLLSSPTMVEKENKRPCIPLGDLHSLSLHELKERKKENKEENKRLRKALRDFEEQFEREYGRKVQKEDRGPQEQTYLDYKHSKAKQRLLEALLSKLKKM